MEPAAMLMGQERGGGSRVGRKWRRTNNEVDSNREQKGWVIE